MDNFIGTIAIFQPEGALETAKIGVISAISDTPGLVDMRFGSLEKHSVSTADLRVLIDRQSLYRMLLSEALNLGTADFKTLFQVNMLQDRGDISSLLQAYQLLKSSSSAVMMATIPLSAHLQLSPEIKTPFSR